MKSTLWAIVLCAVTSAACAETYQRNGFYVGASGGASMMDNFGVTRAYGVRTIKPEFIFRGGYNLFGHLGYQYRAFRVEGSIGMMSSSLRIIRGSIDNPVNPIVSNQGRRGRNRLVAFMVNGFWDLDVWLHKPFVPYIGAGLGFARIHATASATNFKENPAVVNVVRPANGAMTINFNEGVFAYQFMAGTKYHFNHWLVGHLEYRYFGTSNFKAVSSRYSSHLLAAGLSLKLGG